MDEKRTSFIRRRLHHLVFAVGMLALVLGVSLSAWLLLQQRAVQQDIRDIEVAAAQAAETGDVEALARTLERVLGLPPEQAASLSQRLKEEVEGARAASQVEEAVPQGALEGGGPAEQAAIGESVDIVIKDGSGKVKESWSSK